MKAIEQFSELGSGIQIAMKDLEIRGAGDILGGEQSGFINEIGFDTYQKILEEAIDELKGNEFKELFPGDLDSKEKIYVREVQIDTDIEILFPDEYINIVSERLTLYNELSKIKEEQKLKEFEKNLEDRFGKIPPQGIELLNTLRLKWLATKFGLERVIIKQKKCIGYFISDQQSDFFQTPVFSQILNAVQSDTQSMSIKEKQTRNGLRLLLIVENVYSIEKLYQKLEAILASLE
jgi:transcription-repair coupling factor (superfamily II helicase)